MPKLSIIPDHINPNLFDLSWDGEFLVVAKPRETIERDFKLVARVLKSLGFKFLEECAYPTGGLDVVLEKDHGTKDHPSVLQ